PSVTGEAEHWGLVSWEGSFSAKTTPDCQSCFPVERSKQIRVRRLSFSMACVTNTRFPQITGVELPRSGSGTRQRTFWLVSQCKGSDVSEEIPWPVGPRQPGQFAPAAETGRRAVASSQRPQKRKILLVVIEINAPASLHSSSPPAPRRTKRP